MGFGTRSESEVFAFFVVSSPVAVVHSPTHSQQLSLLDEGVEEQATGGSETLVLVAWIVDSLTEYTGRGHPTFAIGTGHES